MANRCREDLEPHGTLAAYRRHYRHGEQPCESCKKADMRRWQDVSYPRRNQRRQTARRAEPTRTPLPERTRSR